jgi:glycosyltransferase involved in cell wall biosynthesis
MESRLRPATSTASLGTEQREGGAAGMHVVLVTGIFPPDIGGPATHSSDLREELTHRGHHVTILTLGDQPRREVRTSLVRFPRNWPWPIRLAAVSSWLAAYGRHYDVVYATGMQAAAVIGARLARRPVVVKLVGDPAWERGVRLGLTEAEFDSFQGARNGGVSLEAMRALRNWTVRTATKVTVPSEYLGRVVRGWVGDRADIQVIPNGVQVSRAALAAGRRPEGPLRLVFVGRLVSHKHVDMLVDAVARTRGTELEIVGDGPTRSSLEETVRREAVADRVRFLGSLPHGEVLAHLAEADALVTASGYEGLPHVVIEALACGTPVIGPPVGGLPEVIEDGSTGIIVDPVTSESTGKALARLRDNPALRERLASNAAREGKEWRFERCAERIEALLHEAIGKPRALFVGKSNVPHPVGHDLERKFEILGQYFSATVVHSGAPRLRRVGEAMLVVLPALRPPLFGGLVFYVSAPLLALGLTVGRRRSVIVCQSSYEALGVVGLSRLIPRQFRPAIVVEVHGDWRTAARLYGIAARRWMVPATDRLSVWVLQRADRVRTISSYTSNLVREVGYRGPIDSFPTYSDYRAFVDASLSPFPSEPQVLYVGTLDRHKGLDVLLAAWQLLHERLPRARLSVVGSGPLSTWIREQARNGALMGSIDVRGPLPRAQVLTEMDGSQCLVLPSRSEGLGRVLMESMARARPVVATRVGGIPEVVDHGRTGLLVRPGEPAELASAISALLTDPGRAQAMGLRARDVELRRNPAAQYAEGIARLAAWVEQRAAGVS